MSASAGEGIDGAKKIGPERRAAGEAAEFAGEKLGEGKSLRQRGDGHAAEGDFGPMCGGAQGEAETQAVELADEGEARAALGEGGRKMWGRIHGVAVGRNCRRQE